jgi:hypothetical protein
MNSAKIQLNFEMCKVLIKRVVMICLEVILSG